MSGRRDRGDFQTPPDLARAVLATLGPIAGRWSRVLEPTCGAGAFLHAALQTAPAPDELIGIEIDEAHCSAARSAVAACGSARVQVVHADLFQLDLGRDLRWNSRGPLLVVGNPPWVTSSALGRLASTNGPARRNLRSLPGIAALTGASNFDLGEAVWIKLIEELADERPTIAMLCKTAVARSVLDFVHRRGLPIADASLREIDASRWFGASVRACLFRLSLGRGDGSIAVPVHADLHEPTPTQVMTYHQGQLVADGRALERVGFALGNCPLTWRQGLKHDAAAVMELTASGPGEPLRNGLGETVDVEPGFVYPLIKGADLRKAAAGRPSRSVLLTQHRIGEPTGDLEARAPRLWAYLRRHTERFEHRRSAIYRRQPPFAVFGVGPYSFAPWKVAVSGLHRPALFRVVGPRAGRPAMLDDTGYLLPCESAAEAAVLAALCNHRTALALIEALSFPGAKRPVTKGLLQRLDLSAILGRSDRGELIAQAATTLAEVTDGSIEPSAAIEREIARIEQRFQDVLTTESRPH